MHSLGRNELAFTLLHFVLQGQTCLLLDTKQFSSPTLRVRVLPCPSLMGLQCFLLSLVIHSGLSSNEGKLFSVEDWGDVVVVSGVTPQIVTSGLNNLIDGC